MSTEILYFQYEPGPGSGYCLHHHRFLHVAGVALMSDSEIISLCFVFSMNLALVLGIVFTITGFFMLQVWH